MIVAGDPAVKINLCCRKKRCIIEYFVDLFQLLRAAYGVNASIYPGSFVHITPSFVFPLTTYIETDKRSKQFFGYAGLTAFIEQRKTYPQDAEIQFNAKDNREVMDGKKKAMICSSHNMPGLSRNTANAI